MNLNCVICSDLLTPTAEVHVTKCGHMFHYTCLMNWLERYGCMCRYIKTKIIATVYRKKTCPQCRSTVTEKAIVRVYFTVTDVGAAEDVGTLMNKIESLQFQITLNNKDITNYKNKTKTLTENNGILR